MLSDSLLHFFEDVGAEWVLWLLMVLGLLMLIIIIERFIFFRKHRVDEGALRERVLGALRRGGAEAAFKEIENVQGMPGGVLQAAIHAHEDGVESVEQVIHATIMQERVHYDRFLSILGTLGNSAPFIGLFGTVIGILTAFSALGQDLGGDVMKQQVMSSIGEALVATAVGLAVAIPAVVSFNAYKNRIKVMAANTEGMARMILAHFKAAERSGDDDGGR